MIYFDNAATTRASEKTKELISYYATEMFFNPSAMYHEGISAKEAIEEARRNLLSSIKGEGGLVFTSGGTESDNLALFGTKKPNGSRIIVSAAEHAAVYYSALELKNKGYEVVFCPVDNSGRVDADAFRELVNVNTSLVSIMHVNNETGAVNDIKKLNTIAKAANPKLLFHSDGVQALGKVNVNIRSLGIDLYSVSSHKIHGSKGTGALYFGKNVHLSPIIIGGGQEKGLRSSTENTGGIVAFGEAAKTAVETLLTRTKDAELIRNTLISGLKEIADFRIINSAEQSPFILAFVSDKVRGEVVEHALERKGILVGTGSACSSNKASERISRALELNGKFSKGLVRLSFSEENTVEDANEFLREFAILYKELSKYGS